jgi:hypothetical protein
MEAKVPSQILELVGQESLEASTLQYLADLASLVKNFEFRETTHHKGRTSFGQSKVVNAYFSEEQVKKWGFLELIQLTDMQFGHKSCKIDRVKQFMDYVLAKPNRYVLMTGDNVDAATVKSPGSPWDNWFEPQSGVYKFCKMIAPIRHRTLGYVGGNHERRGIPAFGDLGFLIATLLQLPYSNGQQLINVNFGGHKPFKIHLWHGLPRARTKGALAQIIDRFMQQGDSQLYLTGHNHQALVVPVHRMSHNATGDIRVMKVIGASGTSFLEFWGTYAEVMGFSASDTIMPVTILEPEGGNAWEMRIR